MHKLTANTDGLTEVAASQQGSTDLEIRAEQISTAAMGEWWMAWKAVNMLNGKECGKYFKSQLKSKNRTIGWSAQCLALRTPDLKIVGSIPNVDKNDQFCG